MKEYSKKDMLSWSRFSRETECLWPNEDERFKEWSKDKRCDHEWIGLHGHPAALECIKCGKLEKTI